LQANLDKHFQIEVPVLNNIPLVCEKGTANKPLTEEQEARNRIKSNHRCRIEHIFGFIENSMGGSFVRCVGIKRTAAYQWLTMFVYNICQQIQLQA
jgi:transposase DDE domain